MILYDFSGTVYATIAVDMKKSMGSLPNMDYVRYLILNSLRSVTSKFRKDFGELVICLDSPHSWRKQKYSFYKAARQQSRINSGINWNRIFEMVNELIEEYRSSLPYTFLKVPETEADDIIAVLSKNIDSIPKKNILDSSVLIVSKDKDMKQLHKYKYVSQYDPRTHLVFREENPKLYVIEQVLNGDKSDGIPNIRSEATSFLDKKRQKCINQQFVRDFIQYGTSVLNEEELQRYNENEELINFEKIPDSVEKKILDSYEIEYLKEKPKKTLLLKYLCYHNIPSLVDKIMDF